ncbi:GNAT family N-acetyltransferase [Enemella sp. A6]|uniref:GNAT family N-acetyltransferase n=1 Tax=Enemella sp. A6 TaxID=3440152 RepID=UPI003EC10DCF
MGAVRLRRVGEAVELGRLTVVPDLQGRGIGTCLLTESEMVFPDATEVRLFTGEHSVANIRLYERCGYVETARTPAGDYSLVHFTKHLP